MKASSSLIFTLGLIAACTLLPPFVAGCAALGAIGGILIAERIEARRKRELAAAAMPLTPVAAAALQRLMREEWGACENREQQRQAAPNVLWREDRFLRRHQ